VYVVWLPVLPLDDRFEVADVVVDPRASHFWDNDQIVSAALADAFGDDGLVWDAFYVFDDEAAWDARPPTPLGTGAPVVAQMTRLRALLEPYLD
jgi:hypothetical protein